MPQWEDASARHGKSGVRGPTEDECGIGRHQRCGDQGVELMAELEIGLAQEFLMKDEWHSNSVNQTHNSTWL